MNQQKKETVGCARCGKMFSVLLYPAIDIRQMPWAKSRLLNCTFFRHRCPSCGTANEFCYPTLYHDRKAKLMVKLHVMEIPEYERIPFPLPPPCRGGVRQYCFREVVGPGELAEKIRIFDAGLNDFKIEAVKLCMQIQHHYFDLKFLAACGNTLIFYNSALKPPRVELVTMDIRSMNRSTDIFDDDFLYIQSYLHVDKKLIQQILLH